MSSKEIKPQICIDVVKDVVKRYKNKGIQQLSHHDLAVGLTTIGFREVCKEFGAVWNDKTDKEALVKLNNSEYDLSWFGKVNNPNYVPFLQLCARGDIEKIKEFLFTVGKKAKAELIATTDNFKRTALHLAVKEGFDVLAEYLIGQGFSLNARDRELKTPLHYCKSELICQLLLKKGANVTLRDNKQRMLYQRNCTIAHYAASGSEYRVLELVLKKTNIVNQPDATLKTPLFYAIYNATDEQVNILRILLQNAAKINEQDSLGKTPLHYASEMGRTRCIPFLLQKGASVDIRDKLGKTPLDLSSSDKVTKLFGAYRQSKGIPSDKQQKVKRIQFSKIAQNTSKQNFSKLIKEKDIDKSSTKTNPQIYTKEVNQVSTWVRQKFFVLMKKLQESGIKSLWHIKRPYIYTGSWAEDVEGLQDLYECFINVSGAQAAMRTFNILCPYQKQLPTVLGKSQQAFQSFFGENWFSNDPVEKVRNMHSQAKIRTQLQQKVKEAEDLKTQLLGYRSEIEKLEGNIMSLKQELNHYQKIEQQLRKERAKNTLQYTEILKHMNQISNLKDQLTRLNSGEEKTEILSNMVEQLRSKNEDLQSEINVIKVNQAAARRKCGQLFLKSLSLAKSGESVAPSDENNLFDDDAIINLYELLRSNPPNLQKRFKLADKRGTGKLNIQEFTKLLQNLSMLPQDVMSMHRITGFSQGRKTLSLQEFKTILENRHKNRPMWQKQLIRKIKTIILSNNISLQQFFKIVDVDGSGTVQPAELRKGLQDCNIFMNQTDWSNLFNLLDADKSGTIQLEEMKALFQKEATGKMEQMDSVIKKEEEEEEEENKQEQQSRQEHSEVNAEEEEKEQEGEKVDKEQSEKEPKEERQQQSQEEQQEAEQKEEEPRADNQLLSNDEQFKEEYQQQDSQAEAGITKLNGVIKVQVPMVKDLLLSQQDSQKVYIRFVIAEFQTIKMANLQLPKLSIAIKFEMIEYKVMDMSELKMHVSVFKTRDFDQQNYLGQFVVELVNMLEHPNQWVVNNQFALQASEYEKEVSGAMVLQVKWIPNEE